MIIIHNYLVVELFMIIKHNLFSEYILYTIVCECKLLSDYFLCLSTYASFLQDKMRPSSYDTVLLDYYAASTR